ncbi:D-glucuronyl C5-epimerase family protein [Caulobacter sp. KR2-114]|uniref:D-glucuronyl C5-epimerase family protein n=1 Tax=Caulobacter sp. KR2-114 TaxID=3400912 RepID=UPI003BFD72EB
MAEGRRLTPRKTLAGVVADMGSFLKGARQDYAADLAADPLAYPLAFDRLLEADPALFSPLDEDGVPVKGPPGAPGRYMPSRIAGYALAQWNLHRRGDGEAAARFLPAAEWFAGQAGGDFMHDLPIEGMAVPWPSCLAQGEGVSVLVRAWRLTGEARFLDQARAALPMLQRPVACGGVASTLPDGSFFVEEYPGGRHRHVLNGALFAAVGLDDLVRLSDSAEPVAESLRDRLLAALADNLGLWSSGDWSVYSVERAALGARNACTLHYQLVHVALLQHLATLSPGLAPLTARWSRGARRPATRLRALGMKVFYRAANGW